MEDVNQTATQTPDVQPDPNQPVWPKEFTFHFKKEKLRDSEGKVIGEGKKHPSIVAKIPTLQVKGLLDIIEKGGKGLELLLEATDEVIVGQARSLINELREKSPETEITAADLELSKLDWDYIANLPKAERRGGGISKETWEGFIADYKEIMPAALGRTQEQVNTAADIFEKKFNSVKTNKPVISKLLEFLDVWLIQSPNKEEYQACYEFLMDKGKKLLEADEKALLEAL